MTYFLLIKAIIEIARSHIGNILIFIKFIYVFLIQLRAEINIKSKIIISIKIDKLFTRNGAL
jgi:hypothetical protein